MAKPPPVGNSLTNLKERLTLIALGGVVVILVVFGFVAIQLIVLSERLREIAGFPAAAVGIALVVVLIGALLAGVRLVKGGQPRAFASLVGAGIALLSTSSGFDAIGKLDETDKYDWFESATLEIGAALAIGAAFEYILRKYKEDGTEHSVGGQIEAEKTAPWAFATVLLLLILGNK